MHWQTLVCETGSQHPPSSHSRSPILGPSSLFLVPAAPPLGSPSSVCVCVPPQLPLLRSLFWGGCLCHHLKRGGQGEDGWL